MYSRVFAAPAVLAVLAGMSAAQEVEFNRDIRPIFSDKCYTCHGPGVANRQTQLRFDTESAAKQDLGGHFAIVPGDLEKSVIIRRITAANPAMRMPPVRSVYKLSDHEIDLIQRWIQQGAVWEKHWSFIPPKRRQPPEVKEHNWPRNPIDNFVLAHLEQEGLSPSPEADRERLIRRVTLDLTGLPPTPAEIDAFLNDTTPNAYEKVVDRLLASPRYGERMAARWLDAARYADTNGYQTDAERSMWRWRDWVIEALNTNMPFDRFTVEQIAGDMLPNATIDQKIATGFNRNHRGNGEGGIIPEEYAVEYVVDRVDTTATVWLGLTLGCARCHDHKYDPLTQKEFYQVFAYFNNVPEKGKAWKYGNSPPVVQAPTMAQQAERAALEARLDAAESAFAKLKLELVQAQAAWEKSDARSVPVDWTITRDMVAQRRLVGNISFDGTRSVEVEDVVGFGFYDKFTLSAWIRPTAPTGAIIARAEDVSEGEGYGLYLKDGKLQANLVKRWLDDALRVETERALEMSQWHHVLMTYDGSRTADGVRIYIDGESQKLKINLDDLNQSFETGEPLRIGAGAGAENRFQGQIHDARVYKVALTPEEAAIAATDTPIPAIVQIPADKRSRAQSDKITLYFLEHDAPLQIQTVWKQVTELRIQRQRFNEALPTVMVMQERPTPRDTFVLLRGAYDRPGERVSRGVPAVLPPLPARYPNNRLGFAKWLVDPSNPLTARVTVNRFWQLYFGVGLVKTVEDFGSQGEWPANLELLDWLAAEFIRTGWDVKSMQKLIVMSATYRQSSKITPDLLQRDPENRLLARGPRIRLSAEMIRDQALAVSGLLVEKIGGPSVKPYQPAGLWKELGGEDYHQDAGEGLYRRSLYTFWKRAVPPPSMMNFDAAGREACTVRENRTNTPLQALDLMNDPAYVEASRVLAERMMREGGATTESRISFAFRLATARRPRIPELAILLESFHRSLDRFRTDSAAAAKFVTEGDHHRDETLDVSNLAAYTNVVSLILNLDETVTKE